MCAAVIHAAVTSHRDVRARLADCDACRTAGTHVVGVAREGPVRRATRCVAEAGAQVQKAAEILAVDAAGRTARTMSAAVIHAAVAADRDVRACLADRDARRTAGTPVIAVASERPVRRATRCVAETGAEAEKTVEILPVDAARRTARTMSAAVIHATVASHRDV